MTLIPCLKKREFLSFIYLSFATFITPLIFLLREWLFYENFVFDYDSAGGILLFQVQPLVGKYILPWFGNSPSVWTTCLLFFQVMLLAGYAYAHFLSNRFKLKPQILLHLALLLGALLFLPIIPSADLKPMPDGDPV